MIGTRGDIAIVFEHITHVRVLDPQCHSGRMYPAGGPKFREPVAPTSTSDLWDICFRAKHTYIMILVDLILGVQIPNRCATIIRDSYRGYIETYGLPWLYPLITSTVPLCVCMIVDCRHL